MAQLVVDIAPLRRYPVFRRLWFGQMVSGVGSQLTLVAVSYQAYRLTHSTLVVGLIGLVQLVPLLAGALWGGTLADAMDRRKVLILTQVAMAAAIGGLAVNASLLHPAVWPLFVCTAASAGFQGWCSRVRHQGRAIAACVVVWGVVCRATAAVTSSGPTSIGRAARRAGQSTPWKPALAAVQTNSGHTAGWRSDALTASPPMAAAIATWVRINTFLRSRASANVPPQRAPASSGTSWTRPIRPTTRLEWVSRYAWYDTATRVSCEPTPDTIWPNHSRRNTGYRRSGAMSTTSWAISKRYRSRRALPHGSRAPGSPGSGRSGRRSERARAPETPQDPP